MTVGILELEESEIKWNWMLSKGNQSESLHMSRTLNIISYLIFTLNSITGIINPKFKWTATAKNLKKLSNLQKVYDLQW